MDQVGMFEAKTHFSEIVDRVVREGRPITVTNRGKPVVDIAPTQSQSKERLSRKEALQELSAMRREVQKMSADEILDLVAVGRRDG